MPLSEDEQRILREIEEQLHRDPNFARDLSPVRSSSRRSLVVSVAGGVLAVAICVLLLAVSPYLAFAAQLMAGIDGIRNRIEPPAPVDKDLYELPAEEAKDIPKAPGTLEEALDALAEDNEFLQAGGVFTQDLIDTWIEYKYENEIRPLSLRPNPYEFELYYGC